jgi:hypothetical protein
MLQKFLFKIAKITYEPLMRNGYTLSKICITLTGAQKETDLYISPISYFFSILSHCYYVGLEVVSLD